MPFPIARRAGAPRASGALPAASPARPGLLPPPHPRPEPSDRTAGWLFTPGASGAACRPGNGLRQAGQGPGSDPGRGAAEASPARARSAGPDQRPGPWISRLGTVHLALRRCAALAVLSVLAGWPAACLAPRAAEAPAPPSEPALAASARSAAPGDLLVDLRQRLRDPSWFAATPRGLGYRPGGLALFFSRPLGNGEGFEPRWLDRAGGEERRELPAEALDRARPVGPEARQGPLELLEWGGDLFLRDSAGGQAPRQLTRSSRRESALRFLAGGERIAFEADGQVYALELSSGALEELFSLRFEADPELEPEPEPEGLAGEELRLMQTLAERQQRERAARERSRELEREDPYRAPRPFYLPAELEERGRDLSASGRYLAVAAGGRGGPGQQDVMPAYVTDSGFVETRSVRAPVGLEPRPGQRLFLLDRELGSQIEVDLQELPGRRDRPLAELEAARDRRAEEKRRAAEAAKTPAKAAGASPTEGATGASTGAGTGAETGAGAEPAPAEPQPKPPASDPAAPRELSIEQLRFAPQGDRLLLELRSTDNKDRWIALLEPGQPLRVLEHRRDPAWIGWDFAQTGWLPDGSGLWWLSERSGHAQLLLQLLAEAEPRVLSPAGSEVRDVQLAPDGQSLFLLSNQSHPGIQRLAQVGLPAGPFELLSAPLGRVEEFDQSPDGSRLCFLRSTALAPAEVFEMEARAGAPERRLTLSTSAEFQEIAWIEPRFVVVPGPGGPIHGRLYLPPEGAPQPGGAAGRPAVLFAHGAGYLQNAHQGWSGYFREFFFHDLLARQGLVVLDLDYRASAGYGRDWRTAIHRCMGQPELEDLAAGVDFLVREQGVDPARVGLYGGSYGGFLTLMALFTRPGLFACGAALRPVTDWRHYNDGYTRNILETPELDPEGFARASPIEHAAGLERPLLICHGLVDDNVLAKDSIRLSQRLIELGKADWELALYPLEAHGFREPSAWIDEYTRIWRLFQRCLLAPPGER